MRWLVLFAALLCSPALAQVPMTGAGAGVPSSGGLTLSLDGVGGVGTTGSGNSTTATMSTSLPNDIIIVFVATNFTTVASVSGSTLGAFAFRASSGAGSAGPIEEWWVRAPSALTSEVITVTITTGPTFIAATAFAVNGGKLSGSPFDGVSAVTGTSDPLSITTASANTFIMGGFRVGTASPTAGAGYTAIQLNSNFELSEYKIVSTTQTGLSVTIGTGVGTANGGIADALVQGP